MARRSFAMGREPLLRRLQREWQAFQDAVAGLPDAVLVKPGIVGRWSLRDVLCHITTWEEEFLKVLPLILAGQPLPRYGGIDAFNDREQERKRGLSLDAVKRQLAATHERLLAAVAGLPQVDDTVERRLRRRLRLDTYHHYQEPAAQIVAWRKV